MKLQSTILALATTLALIVPAEASLKHANADVFQILADLTRAPQERSHLSINDVKKLSSEDFPYQDTGGVGWQVHFKDASAHGKSREQKMRISTGQENSVGFQIGPLSTNTKLKQKHSKKSHQKHRVSSEKRLDGSQGGDAARGTEPPHQNGQYSPSDFYPIQPPSIPLAVKGPYFNTWAPAGRLESATPPNVVGNGGYLAGQDASFWTSSYGADGDYRMSWTGFIRIDNTTYQWMGDSFGTTVRSGKNANQISATYTSTRSIFTFEASGVRFNVTFMTPIWPNDYFRQSLPMSYLHFELDHNTAQGRSIQLYTDIDERWVSGHDYDYENYPIKMVSQSHLLFRKRKDWPRGKCSLSNNLQQWMDDSNSTSMYFVERTNPQVYTEFRQRAEWGSAVYAMRKRAGMSSRNNNNVVTQLEFLTMGNVTYDHNPVGGSDNAFSYSVDFDGKGGNDALFAVGHVRSPYVNYIKATPGTNGTKSYQEDRYGYWMSKFPQFSDMVTFFMDDFENALSHCKQLDAQIDADSKAVVGGGQTGDMYAAITQLSVRQAFATIEITIPYNNKTYNTSDTLIFLKEISSNGDMQTVDVFFPLFPLLTYLNPDFLRDILKPIFEYTESGLYPNKWCVHDLGVYPNAFGHNDGKDEPMQVEESGNMILMTLHWAQMVGKKAATPFLTQHYKIMQQWAQFLITDSLIPAEQLSTDDFAGQAANQSDLAIKGIEGIAAMGHIADWLGHSSDAKNYANISSTYIQAFYGYAINKAGTHTKLVYQNDSSWGTLYNLAFDRLLNLRLVAKHLYDIQDTYYPTVAEEYGIPLDSRYSWQKSDWAMFASATAALKSTRDLFIEKLYKFVSSRRTDAPFTDLFETQTGDFPKLPYTPKVDFLARPVVGGHFMHLAIDKANKLNNVTDYQYGPPINNSTKDNTEEALGTIRYNLAKEGRLVNYSLEKEGKKANKGEKHKKDGKKHKHEDSGSSRSSSSNDAEQWSPKEVKENQALNRGSQRTFAKQRRSVRHPWN